MMQTIRFWNGNKSNARQEFELALLDSCLWATQEVYGLYTLLSDYTDHPDAEDEGNIFESGCDVIVTVAGNVKFKNKQKIVLNRPLSKGLLGYRLLIVRNDSLQRFRALTDIRELQALSVGIPATWADAELFRQNQIQVVERGTLADIFIRLANKEFDFIALGANEIEEVFARNTKPLNGMCIETSMMIYYPFPLVFYIHPQNFALAKRVEEGLLNIMQNGQYEILFRKHHGDVVERLNLTGRKTFTLHNPLLPKEMQNFSASLLT